MKWTNVPACTRSIVSPRSTRPGLSYLSPSCSGRAGPWARVVSRARESKTCQTHAMPDLHFERSVDCKAKKHGRESARPQGLARGGTGRRDPPCPCCLPCWLRRRRRAQLARLRTRRAHTRPLRACCLLSVDAASDDDDDDGDDGGCTSSERTTRRRKLDSSSSGTRSRARLARSPALQLHGRERQSIDVPGAARQQLCTFQEEMSCAHDCTLARSYAAHELVAAPADNEQEQEQRRERKNRRRATGARGKTTRAGARRPEAA